MVEPGVQANLPESSTVSPKQGAEEVCICSSYIMPLLIILSSYLNSTTGQYIDYYEIEVKPFEQQVYPGLKKAQLVGYDGISPGPTFRMERNREAVVRFVNRGEKDLSVHLHGSYSVFHLMLSPHLPVY